MKQTINRLANRLGALMLGYALLVSAFAADTPQRMTYQGHLLDANGNPVGNPLPVNKTVEFHVYDVEEEGNPIWSEQQIVTVDNGYFSVVLGEGTTLSGSGSNLFVNMEPGIPYSDARYVGLKVDGEEIAPRLRLLTVPYAQLSKHAVSAQDADQAVSAQIAETLENSSEAREGLGFVPKRGIIMWNDQTIPPGWRICNGTGGTPNLVGRFVMGAGASASLGENGGASEVVIEEKHMASHRHTIDEANLGNHDHDASSSGGSHGHGITTTISGAHHNTNPKRPQWNHNSLGSWGDRHINRYSTDNSTSHAHTINVLEAGLGSHGHTMTSEGGDAPLENLPPYYVLYYIQRVE